MLGCVVYRSCKDSWFVVSWRVLQTVTLNQNCLGWLNSRPTRHGWSGLPCVCRSLAELRLEAMSCDPPSVCSWLHAQSAGQTRKTSALFLRNDSLALFLSPLVGHFVLVYFFGSPLAPDKCWGSRALWSQNVIALITVYQGRFCSGHA